MGLKRISKKNSILQDNAIKSTKSVQEILDINKQISNKKSILQNDEQTQCTQQNDVMESTENVQEDQKENYMSELTENEQTQRVQMLLSLIAFTLLANATALVIVTSFELSVLRDEKCTCKDINSLQKHEKGKVLGAVHK